MADNYTFKDAGGNTITHASDEITTGVHASRHVLVYLGDTVKSAAVSVAATATALPGSTLSDRRALLVYNNGSATIYLGASDVTTAAGFPLLPSQSISLEVGELAIYGIVATGTVQARVMEIA